MSKRDDDELINYIVTGFQMIVCGAERALQGNERFWAYDKHYLRRRRPKLDVPPQTSPRIWQLYVASLAT